MADANANIRIGVDTSAALAEIKNLQRQISLFHSSMAASGKAAADQSARMQANLMNSINATRGFTARMTTISTTTDSFTNALEKNKLSMGQYFRYAGGATKSFGSLFKSEFNTISKVARERVKDLQTQYIKMGRDADGAMKAIAVRPTTLDMKNLGTQTAIAAQKQQLFNQLIRQGSTNLLNWGKNTQWAGRQLMVGFTIPLTIFGTVAAKTFMDLEEQAIRFKRVYGDMFTTDTEVDEALAGVKELASEFTKFGVAVEDTIDLAASVAQMGAMGADLTNQVTQATRLAVLGGIEQQDALDTTISLTNAFGLATEELAGKIAFLNAAENQTILSIEDFNEAIPKAGSVVKQLGGDVEDLAFFLTAMREGGINASQSANALKSSLARLINPTEVAKEKMAGFGIDILGIVNDNAGNLRETIQVLAVELDKLDPLDKSRAIEQLFGKFQFARMSTLFENIVKEGSQANKILELTTNSTEELAIIAERELGRVSESPAYKFKKALEEIQVALAPIGEAFLKLATPIIEFGTRVMDQFNNLSDGAKTFVVGLTAVLGVVAPAVLMVIGLVANGIANLVKFGQLVARAFGSSRTSSNNLTEQLNYMNAEQVESAAIAASLEQAHSRLTQEFTAEAGAVNKLTAAYTRAIEKQKLMMMSGPGAARTGGRVGAKVKGYNKGVVSVPGSGNKDTVPAMLTPGESVIPAEMTKRYAPLIEAMVAGAIPGYNRGRNPYQRSHITGQLDPNDPNVFSQLQAMYPGTSAAQLQNFEVLSDLTMDLPEWMNQDLRPKSGGIAPDQFDFSSKQTKNKLLATSKSAAQDMGLELGDEYLSGLSQGFEDEITDRASSLARQRGVNVTDPILSEAREEVLEKARKQGGSRGLLAEGLQRKATTVGSTRAALGGQEDAKLRKMLERGEAKVVRGTGGGLSVFSANADGSQGPKIGRFSGGSSDPELQKWFNEGADPKKLPPKYKMRGSSSTPRAGTYETRTRMANTPGGISSRATEQRQQARKDFNDQAAKSAQTNSESKRTKRIAKDTVDGYANELKRGKKKVQQTAKEKAKLEQQSKDRLYGGAQPTPQEKAARRQAEKRAKQDAAQQRRTDRLRREQNQRMYGTQNVTPEMRAARKQQENLEKQRRATLKQQQKNNQTQTRIVNQEQVNTKKLSVVERLKERALRRQQARLTREQAVSARAAAGGGMGAGRMMGVGMAASSAVMMGSMAPGKVGEVAGSLMGPVMALSMALPMLTSPIGVVVAALGALGGSLWFLNSSFNKGAEEGMKMAEAFGVGSKAIKSFAENAGNVSAGEIMDKRREEAGQILNIQPGKSTFGETFLQGDPGKEMVENLRKTFESGQSMGDVRSALINQMGTAIATGALSAGQARSIVAELAEEMGDYNLGIQVNGELLSMFGPDGEDLLENPLELRVRLVEESRENIRRMGQLVSEQGPRTAGRIGGNVAIGGGVGAAAGGLAATQTGIGNRIATQLAGGIAKIAAKAGARTAATAAAGTAAGPIGTAIGAVAGIGLGIADAAKYMKDLGVLTGGFVASGAMALQQQQELLDSLQLDYEKRIQIADAAGDTAEAERLQNQYIEDRAALLEENAKTTQAFLDTYSEFDILSKRATSDSLSKQLSSLYEDQPLMQAQLDSLVQQIEGLDFNFFADSEKEIQLKMSLLSGDLSPGALSSLLNLDDDTIDVGVNLLAKLGQAEGNRALSLMSMFVDNEGNPITEQQTKFLATVDAAPSGAEATKYLDLFQEIQEIGNVANMQIVLDYYLNDPNAASRLSGQLNEIRNIAAQNEGSLSIDVFSNVFDDPEAREALMDYADEFDALPDSMKIEFIESFTKLYNVDGDPDELAAFRAEEGSDATRGEFDVSRADRLVRGAMAEGAASDFDEETDTGGGGGGGPQASELDDIIKKLRDVRLATIDMTKGWEASRDKLEELFGDGKDIDVFDGLKQRMRGMGLGENLIDVIAGMPAEEYERRKNQLFTFDEAGNITGITKTLGNMQRAMNAVALGEFHNEQQAVLAGLNDQIVAHRKLTAAGLSNAQAYEAVKNKAFAAAIAREQDNSKIKESIRLMEKATEVSRAYQAAQALARKNEEVGDLRGVASFIQKNAKSLSEAQKEAILNDKDLQTLVMNPEVDPKTLRQALKNAENQADLDLKIKKLTFDGLVDVFNDGFNNAMEAFSVKEKEIELDFAVKEEPFLEAIKDAEREIADIRNSAGGLDDLQASLERISWQEEEINEKYDLRTEALEKVKDINKTISDQQKSQLDIAEALSRGDIAAAAKAVQESRKQRAQASQAKQEKQLDIVREKELAALVDASGRSRLEIEKEIERLNRTIFEIEEQRIEPAQRQLDILNRQKQDLIEGLTVLGKTREEWERVKNNVDLARISTDKFIKSMEDALDVVTDIVDYWDNFPTEKHVDIFQNVKRMGEEEDDLPEADDGLLGSKDGPGGGTEEEKDKKLSVDDSRAKFRRQESLDMARWEAQQREQEEDATPQWFDKLFTDFSIFQPKDEDGNRRTDLEPRIGFDVGQGPTYDAIKPLFTRFDGKDEPSWTEKALDWLTTPLWGPGSKNRGSGSPVEETSASSRPQVPRTSDGKIDYDRLPEPQTAGFSLPGLSLPGFGSPSSSAMRGSGSPAGGALGPIRGEITKLNSDIPMLLAGVDNHFRTLPERTNQPIVGGVGNNFRTLGSRTPENLSGIPNYLKGPLASQAQEGINSGIRNPLRRTGDESPSYFTPLSRFFTTDLVNSSSEATGKILPDHLSSLGREAPGRLNPITGFFDKLPGKAKPSIEGDLVAAFEALGNNAPLVLAKITRYLTEMPSLPSIRGAIGVRLPLLFLQAGLSSIRLFKIIETYFRSLPTIVRGLINGISFMFYLEGRESATAFINEVKRQFNNFKPEVTITRKIITVYETQTNAGGLIGSYNTGGAVAGFNNGGGYRGLPMSRKVSGSGNYDKVKTLLTPGEFVIRKEAVEKYGDGLMAVINSAKLPRESFMMPTFENGSSSSTSYRNNVDAQKSGVMYNSNNYAINVNVRSEANPDQIAKTVMNNIKRVDSQRIRSNRL